MLYEFFELMLGAWLANKSNEEEIGTGHTFAIIGWSFLTFFIVLVALINIILTDFVTILGVRESEGLALKLLWAIVVMVGWLIPAICYLIWKYCRMKKFRSDTSLMEFKDRYNPQELKGDD